MNMQARAETLVAPREALQNPRAELEAEEVESTTLYVKNLAFTTTGAWFPNFN